jgi:microcystin-dependent protein
MTNLQDFKNRSEVGTIKPWPKATAPSGYLLCDGTAVSRTTYAELYAVTGDTYGAGNGSTTFNVPQLQGKTPQGYDGNTYNLAGTGGANTVTVAVTNNQAVNSTLANNQAVNSTIANNQTVAVTGSIDTTSLTTAQIASHSHLNIGQGETVGENYSAAHTQLGARYQDQGGQGIMTTAGSGTGHTHSHTLSGTLSGSVAITNALTGTTAITNALTGAVTAAGNNTFSPYVVVNYIIKH